MRIYTWYRVTSENNVSSLYCRVQRLNSGDQAWWQSPLSTQPSCWPLQVFTHNNVSYHSFMTNILNDRAQV